MDGTSARPRKARIACRCLGLADFRLRELARTGGLETVAQVTEASGAGGSCETCHPEIEEILAECRGERVDAELRSQNRRTCAAETRARLVEWLEKVAVPCLAELDASLDGFRIEGLAVRLRLGGRADTGVLRLLGDAMRAEVCADLEVEPLR
jgi:NAD(P)H-nitrite reductase large subunit